MAIILGPGPAKGVPLERLKKAISLKDFVNKLDCWGQAVVLRKSVPAIVVASFGRLARRPY